MPQKLPHDLADLLDTLCPGWNMDTELSDFEILEISAFAEDRAGLRIPHSDLNREFFGTVQRAATYLEAGLALRSLLLLQK